VCAMITVLVRDVLQHSLIGTLLPRLSSTLVERFVPYTFVLSSNPHLLERACVRRG
jgi:hypothetical protein